MRNLLPALLVCQLTATSAWAADTMRAIVIVDGGATLQSVPKPEPQATEVRIEVRAVSVNPVDWKIADHAAPGSRLIAGRDLSGTIDAVGSAAGPWKKGQAVIAIAAGGSYAEYAVASVRAVALKPPNLSFEEAAGLPVVGETAWRAMVTVAAVQAGERVLIHGGAGGVGSLAVQIAKARGAHVIATASAQHAALLRSLGADEVIDYHSVKLEQAVHDVDVVLNTVDMDTNVRSVALVKRGGILVSVVGPPPAAQCAAAGIRCAVTGSATGEMLGAVSDLASQGKLHVHIDQQLPLQEADKAWDASRHGHVGGKIILEVSSLRIRSAR